MDRKYIFGYDTLNMDSCLSSNVPLKIGFEILHDCNLFCDYCYLGEIKNRNKDYLDTEVAKKILRKIKAEGVSSVQFFGGEATLHPNLIELIKYAKAINILDVGVLTNGMCDDLNLIENIGLLCDWVHVTIRGLPDTFDTHTKVLGSFDNALRTLKILNATNSYVGIEYDCCHDNFEQLEDVITLLIDKNKINIKEIWLHRIAPKGSASLNKNILTINDYLNLLMQCKKIEEKYGINCKMEDSLPLCLFEIQYHKYILPCKGGFVSAYIDPKGNMKRCASSTYLLGNIFEHSINHVWRQSDIMKNFSSLNWLPIQCKQCMKINDCRGGCSVSAKEDTDHTQDIFSSLFRPYK